MKKINIQSSKWFLPVVFLTLLTLAACDPDDDYNDNLGPMRMFMPGGVISSVSGDEQVRLSWRTPANTQESNATYTVEVATDTLFQSPVMVNGAVFSAQTDSTGIVFTDEQLQVQQRYYARIKTNATDDRPESKWLYSSRFMIRGQQILQTPGIFDITHNSVVLKWTHNPNVNRIVLTPVVEGGAPIEVELTDDDRAANMKSITGLQPSTGYRAQIFQNNTMRGFLTFRTISGLEGVVVNLAGNTDPGALMEAIEKAPSGSTIMLPKGSTYNISSTVTLDKSITIRSEISTDPNLATILFTSNFNVAAGSVIDSVVFRDVHMVSDNYASRYVMNISAASTVRNIKFQGAQVEIFRGVVRLQGAVSVNRFSVINSVIDSISNYGILAIDNTSASVRDISILNSTISKVERPIVSRTESNSILIQNTTFNEAPEDSRYIIDYATNNVTNGIRVVDSIFGIGKALGSVREGRGIRAGAGTAVQSSGSYSTSDRVVKSNPIPGINAYNKTSFELFRNPKNGDFTIIDPAFPGRNTAGDPRWRQ